MSIDDQTRPSYQLLIDTDDASTGSRVAIAVSSIDVPDVKIKQRQQIVIVHRQVQKLLGHLSQSGVLTKRGRRGCLVARDFTVGTTDIYPIRATNYRMLIRGFSTVPQIYTMLDKAVFEMLDGRYDVHMIPGYKILAEDYGYRVLGIEAHYRRMLGFQP